MNGKTLTTIVIALIFSAISLPVVQRVYHQDSFYQPTLGFIYCKSEWDCRHEVGHMMDDDLGYPSKSPEFGTSISAYLYVQFKYGEMNSLTNLILGTPGTMIYSEDYKQFGHESSSSPQEELYASMYADVKGDISKLPPGISNLYRDDPKYERLYAELIKTKYCFCKGEIMNAQMLALWAKVQANKPLIMRAGAAVAGALVGATIVALVERQQEEVITDEELLEEEIVMKQEAGEE